MAAYGTVDLGNFGATTVVTAGAVAADFVPTQKSGRYCLQVTSNAACIKIKRGSDDSEASSGDFLVEGANFVLIHLGLDEVLSYIRSGGSDATIRITACD